MDKIIYKIWTYYVINLKVNVCHFKLYIFNKKNVRNFFISIEHLPLFHSRTYDIINKVLLKITRWHISCTSNNKMRNCFTPFGVNQTEFLKHLFEEIDVMAMHGYVRKILKGNAAY